MPLAEDIIFRVLKIAYRNPEIIHPEKIIIGTPAVYTAKSACRIILRRGAVLPISSPVVGNIEPVNFRYRKLRVFNPHRLTTKSGFVPIKPRCRLRRCLPTARIRLRNVRPTCDVVITRSSPRCATHSRKFIPEQINITQSVLKDASCAEWVDVISLSETTAVLTRWNLGRAFCRGLKLGSHRASSVSKVELFYYWKELVKRTPNMDGRDLELLAIFPGIEWERFEKITYDHRTNTLALVPKPYQPGQFPGRMKRYDIIYGKFKPTGKLLSAVLECG